MKIETAGIAIQGARDEMQDAYFVSDDGRTLAVFDGHGPDGAEAAEQAADFFQDTWSRYSSADRTEQFLDCDRELANLDGGTTATVAEIVSYNDDENLVVVHNVGDSPAYLLDKDEFHSNIRLAEYHNWLNYGEEERMEQEGVGIFGCHFEVSRTALLTVSRALGDYGCRGVIARPSKHVDVLRDGSIVVLGSDGVFTRKIEDEVLGGISHAIYRDDIDLASAARQAVDLSSPQTRDNATIILGAVHI